MKKLIKVYLYLIKLKDQRNFLLNIITPHLNIQEATLIVH